MTKKTILSRASLVLFSSLLSLVLLEIFYRLFIFGWASLSYEKMDSVQPLGASGLVQASPFPDVIYELKPDLNSHFKLARFQTNSQGLRDQEYSLSKPASTFRIAVLGDSFTMPSGVTIEQAYHSVLEERLNGRGDGVTYEVINFGVGGYSLKHYLEVLLYKALPYQPDLVLVGFCAETDHRRGLSREQLDGPYRAKSRRPSFFHSFVIHKIKNIFGKGRPLEQGLGTEPLRVSDKQQAQMADVFSRLAELGEREQLPILVAYLSNRVRDPTVVRALAESQGMAFVDVAASFEGQPLGDYIIYAIDGHPNAAAHEIFADRIYEYLTEQPVLLGR